jgi:hypothetical protein
MKKLTTGRRVSSIAELEEGGDYCGPITQSDGLCPGSSSSSRVLGIRRRREGGGRSTP